MSSDKETKPAAPAADKELDDLLDSEFLDFTIYNIRDRSLDPLPVVVTKKNHCR